MASRARLIVVLVAIGMGAPALAQDDQGPPPAPPPTAAPEPPAPPAPPPPPPRAAPAVDREVPRHVAPRAAEREVPRPVVAPTATYPAEGFLLQGNIAATLTTGIGYGDGYGLGTIVSVMPALRLGYQWNRMALAFELNYASISVDSDDSGKSGIHLIWFGPSIQPLFWRSADGRARLSGVLGFGIGAAIAAAEASGGESSTDSRIMGSFHAALLANYFMSRHFGLGVEAGVRAQFAKVSAEYGDVSLSTAGVYVALSFSFVAGQ